MKVTLNWLKDFVDIDVSAEEVASKLTSAGMEVEELVYQNKYLHHVKVGKITKIEKHPSADRLQVCQVDLGSEHTQIITTATNVFEGAVVPVSLPGADLCNGVRIEKAVMRGVESNGMFCSGEELGIDDSFIEGAFVNGILILPSAFKLGQNIDEALGLDDVIFDIGVTPNRPDCMSVIGIAKEVAAVLDKEFKAPDLTYISLGDRASNYIDVQLKSDGCKRYMAAVIKNIKNEKAPEKIRRRLHAVGIKSISMIVDLTNYVLVEMGQPLHAFDRAQIAGKTIMVRNAEKGEKLAVLNHNTYSLNENDLVIADSEKPLVIAGVIGGTSSCITPETKEVVIEAAVFDLKSVRLTSKKIGVRTDSSARFEKGVHFGSAELGLKRMLHFVSEFGVGDILGGVVDKRNGKAVTREIAFNSSEIRQILGLEVDEKTILKILNRLAIETRLENDKMISITPEEREDLENVNDLAEEVIRILGYDSYDDQAGCVMKNTSVTEGKLDEKTRFERKLKSVLVNNGFFEAMNYSICSPDVCEKLLILDNRRFMIKIANPLGEELSVLRTSMANAMLSSLAYNLSVGNTDVKLFESGRTYHPSSLPLEDLPTETSWISIGATDMSYLEFKACVEAVIEETSLNYKLVRSVQPFMHPGVSADVTDEEGDVVATFGQVHPLVAKNFDVTKNTLYAEINISKLVKFAEKKFTVKPVPKFPIVERHIAVLVNENVANADLEAAIKSACGKRFYDVKLFDVYRSDALAPQMKSMAYNIKLSDENKTLTDEEATEIIGKVLKSIKFRYGASLR